VNVGPQSVACADDLLRDRSRLSAPPAAAFGESIVKNKHGGVAPGRSIQIRRSGQDDVNYIARCPIERSFLRLI
jgi:hypothetical protein